MLPSPTTIAGNWFNYTRNPYPNGGYYQIYARMSYGNGPNGRVLKLCNF